jgi:hypothetical protein
MTELNLPSYNSKTRILDEQTQIFDEVRKKWLKLTPEEWVRQHFVHFLINHRQYPAGLIALEKEISILGLTRRSDIVAFRKNGQALLLVECKAPSIRLQTETFSQAAAYNLHWKVPYLVITNGLQHYCAKVDFESGNIEMMADIPFFLTVE